MKPNVMHWLAAALAVAMVTLLLHYVAEKGRATECSKMMHGTIPATSIDIGACLLQFNQPLVTGDD